MSLTQTEKSNFLENVKNLENFTCCITSKERQADILTVYYGQYSAINYVLDITWENMLAGEFASVLTCYDSEKPSKAVHSALQHYTDSIPDCKVELKHKRSNKHQNKTYVKKSYEYGKDDMKAIITMAFDNCTAYQDDIKKISSINPKYGDAILYKNRYITHDLLRLCMAEYNRENDIKMPDKKLKDLARHTIINDMIRKTFEGVED